MKGNFNFDDFKENFLDMMNEVHYNIRQTRNGIEQSTRGVIKEIIKASNDYTDSFRKRLNSLDKEYEESKKRLSDITHAGGKDNYLQKEWSKKLRSEYRTARGAGMSANDAKRYAQTEADKLKGILEKDINRSIKTFNSYSETEKKLNENFKKGLVNERKKVDKELLNRQLNTLTFGFSGRAQRKQDKIETYGSALDGIGGRFNALGRLGRMKSKKLGGGMASKAVSGLAKGLGGLGTAVKIASGLFTKMAGPIGWLISALQLFGDAVNAINEYELKQLELDKEKYQAEVEFRKQKIELENQTKVEQINYEYEILQRNFDVESEIAKAANSLSAQNYAKAVEVSLGSITQGIAQTAFSAASAAIDAGATAMSNVNTANVEREKAAAMNEVRSVKNQAALQNIGQELISSNIAYENATSEIAQKQLHNKQRHWIVSNIQDTSKGALLGATDVMTAGSGPEDDKGVAMSKQRYDKQEAKSVGSAVGDAVINGIKSSSGGLESTQELLEANLAYSNLQRASEQEINKLEIKNANERNNLILEKETELYNKKKDLDKSLYDVNIDNAKKIAHEYLKLTQKEFDVFGKLDETMRKTAIGVGILNENGIEKYLENMTQRMPELMRKWGVSADEIAKLQQSYGEATGRSINLSNADIEKSLGLTMLTGDQGVTNELNADMQIFNMSVANSSQMFSEILDDSRQIGLDMRKMGKNLVRDMKMANRYEFKGGVKALAKMSEWATKVRFDMNNLPNLIDKYTNSLEDSIKNAASVQVLGGNFAANMGDPLKNSYLAHMDPEQLAKNQNEALKGIGYFDSHEGKTKIGIADQMRLKAYSEATGISMESLRAQITQQVQGDKVLSALNSPNSQLYTGKQKELLQQQAFYDGNEWKVTLQDGTTKNINDISESDFADLMPHEEAMYDLTKRGVECLETLVGRNKKLEGETNAEQLELFQSNVQEFYKTYNDMVVTAKGYFDEHKGDFQKAIDENLGIVKNSYKGYLQVAAEGNKDIDEKMKKIQGSADNIATTLDDVSQVFLTAKRKLETELLNGKKENIEAKAEEAQKRVNATAAQETAKAKEVVKGELTSAYENRAIYGMCDGIITQNGIPTRIDSNDQVLAAKDGGPIDKMVSTFQSVMPRSMQYDSYVRENPYGNGGSHGNGKIEVSPIQININGNIQLSGSNGTVDITQQITNDPNFIRSISQVISLEVEKKINGGRVNNVLNRNLEY